ncbi:MAG: hypothetical protein M0R37_14110 [Bacteroidales bacterium]|nr:hypothetical protein [Bacteroidales bacterium]
MAGPNWGNLVEKGRAKAHGIPWTEEEQHARLVLKIPVEFIRDGIVTLEEYEQCLKKGDKPVFRMTKKELQDEATRLGVIYASETPRTELIALVTRAKEKEQLKNPVVLPSSGTGETGSN